MLDRIVLFPILLAQNVLDAGAGVDWLSQFTNNLTNLTTQNGDALTQVGLTELSFIALVALIRMVVSWRTSTMSFGLSHEPVRMGDLIQFLLRLVICCLLENYWVNPLPGANFGLNHLFSYFAQVIVAALDHNSLNSLIHLLRTAGEKTGAPALYAPREIISYFLALLFVGVADAILFLINCSSFIFYGVCALFGPIFIPLLMTRTFRGKFFHFVDVLLSFAMIRAVAAAFIFVWSGFLQGFIQQTFNNDYSIVKWEANLIPCAMVFIAFILNMVFVPSLTQVIFGGGSAIAGRLGQLAETLALASAKGL